MDETSGLYKFVLAMVLVGFLVGISVLLLDKTSVEVKTTGTIRNENVTFTAGTGTSTYDEVISLSGCYDATNKTALVAGSTCNLTNKALGTMQVDSVVAGTPIKVQVNYTYKADSSSSVALDASTSAVGGIASSWMSLIITIAVLSVVLGLVIAGFSGYRPQ